METYLFKFSACLLVFWLVYVLFLERQTMHRFKRFYLLATIVSALIIPVLTITQYVEPVVTDFEVAPVFSPIEASINVAPLQAPFWNLETVLWILYGLGVLLFAIRFVVNLFNMYKRISDNETIAKHSFIYVLLEEYRIPHSFFKYIFFNKLKYETQTIPKEVMLHEETHAKQLHSLDIIVIELLQIVFWFHPLVYILKHHVKLNHEFLADQAVLKQGADAKTYQNILLQFSSNIQDYQLSSAINYSSIKKRFTVMKTQTSKTRIWVSSLLLLPIIAILFYSFAEKEYVENETIKTSEVLQFENELQNEKATAKQIAAYNSWAKKIHTESTVLSDDATFYPPINEQDLIKFSEIYKRMSTKQKNKSVEYPFPGLNLNNNEHNNPTTNQQKATAKQIAQYNSLAKTYNAQPKTQRVIPANDLKQLETIYRLMSDGQKAESLPFPERNLSTEQELPIMQILINRKDQLLVDDKLGTLETIEEKLKKLAKEGKVGGLVSIKYDEETSKQMITKVKELVKTNNFKITTFNASIIMSILINRNDQILVDDELVSLESIANKLKNLTEQGESGRQVLIKHNKETSKEIISKVEDLIRDYKFKVTSFDLSKIPPPPPPPTKAKQYINGKKKTLNEIIKETPKDVESGYEMLENGESHYYTVHKGEKTYYNKDGYITDKKGNVLPPPPPPPPAPKKQQLKEKVVRGYGTISKTDSIKEANRYPNPEARAKALEPITKQGKPSISVQKESIVPMVNGKKLASPKFVMTSSEFKKLKLSLSNSTIESFKLKIPGVKTEYIKGNGITNITLDNLKKMNDSNQIVIFDIKDDKDSKIAPLVIEISD